MYYYNPYTPYAPYMPYRSNNYFDNQENMYEAEEYAPQYMPMSNMYPNMLEMGKSRKCVKVPEVIGKNSCQILLETEIPFAPGYPAMEIKDILKEVKELVFQVCTDKVLINGILHKNINYKTYESAGKMKCDCNEIKVAFGDVRHVSVNIPFKGYIDIPGARKGDLVEVEFAGVEDCCELDILKDPCFIRGCGVPVFRMLKEKVIVKIEVKVLRPVQITVGPEQPNICP